jgi:hypothetical protein
MRLGGKFAVARLGAAFVCAALASCSYDFDGLVAQPGAAGGAGGAGGSAGVSGEGGASGTGGTVDGGNSDGTGGGAGTGGTAGKAGGSGSGGSGGGTSDAGKDSAAGKAGAGDASTDRGPDAIADVRAEQAFDCTAVGGMVYQAHCYYPSSALTTWDTANTTACAPPSHLVVITTQGEQNIVAAILAGKDRWIGLKKDLPPNMESSFHWVTGEALSFKTWDVYDTGLPEPNYTGDCVRMRASNSWGDTSCTETNPAVCEHE